MRKKGLAVFALAAVLTIGTTVFASAAEGWTQSNGSWVYYNAGGSLVYNEWKKGADNLWRFLDGNGQMAISTWVDDSYYVDSNGILVTDKWIKILDPQSGSSSDKYQWYYFGSSGKMITDTWKKIDNKWYYFGSEGYMETGWILDDMSYTGSDGMMRTGWQKLPPPDDDGTPAKVSPSDGDTVDDGKNWYYFSSDGEKYVPEINNGAEYAQKRIDGIFYCFDTEGVMQTGWRNIERDPDDSSSTIADYKYFGSDGKVKTGWLSLEPPTELKGYDEAVEWFYFSSNGTPKTGKENGQATTSDFVKIKEITYLFNDRGNPVYGLQKVYTNSSEEAYTAYFFGDKSASSMVKGKRKVEEGDGTISEFYFSESGRGYTGVKDSYLYYMGKLQKAESGTKYEPISIPSGNSYVTYVVNTSGKVAKSTSVKDGDGIQYKTSSSGTLIQVDGEAPSSSYQQPDEPVWNS